MLVTVTARLNYFVAFSDISLILRSIVALFIRAYWSCG